MIHDFPRRIANDNDPDSYWYCRECDCHAFLLVSSADGGTTIHCASCNRDVTPQISPTLAIGVDLCQP